MNHPALAKSLRTEEIELVTISFNTIYIDVTRAVSSDAKRAGKVTKILESRAQDQHLLTAALGSLLSKHIPTLKKRIEGCDPTQVILNDLDDKGFAVMVWAELLLDVAHVRDNVHCTRADGDLCLPHYLCIKASWEHIHFYEEHGRLTSFEGRNGPITKRLVGQLLTLQVLNDNYHARTKVPEDILVWVCL